MDDVLPSPDAIVGRQIYCHVRRAGRTDRRMPAGVTGVILAGGASRRMGRDKRLLSVDGQPLILRVTDRLRPACDEVLVVTRSDDVALAEFADSSLGRIVHDAWPNQGPLAGMATAAREASHEIVVVVAADMPWLSTPLLSALATRLRLEPQLDAVAVVTDGRPEPMLGVYRRRALARANELLDGGERRASALLAMIALEAWTPTVWRRWDPDGRSAANLNEPADLEPSA